MTKGSIVMLFTPPEPMMSYDIPYSFRQNTNFYYYTGFNEPEAILLMEKTDDTRYTSSMFVREKVPEKEIWDGPRCGSANVARLFGVDKGYNLDQLDVLKKRLDACAPIFMNRVVWDSVMGSVLESDRSDRYNVEGIIQELRLVKSATEVAAMYESGSIAGQTFGEVMAYVRPGMNECEVSACFEFGIKKRGAQRMSYPPVVAGGNNANTIHYIANNALLRDGDLLLMDAGAENWGFTSDITRTFPVNGKFSPAQRDVYAAVLDVNKRCIDMARAGESINSIHKKSVEWTCRHLVALGILKGSPEEAVRTGTYHKYYPHSIGHYLGMDTHDTIDVGYGVTLKSGMIITIEPGIYISADDMSVDAKYRGIAIRVEDDVAISESGAPLVLTRSAPKEIDDIEAVMMKK
eukprot:gene7627-8922_t